jgi:phosphohistidine phosphatase
MKTLYLLRHAKAEPGSKDISDPDRGLAPRGREACELVGKYMSRKMYRPDAALCSTSTRTRQTLELVKAAAGFESKDYFESRLYLAEAPELLSQVQALVDGVRSVLVVGHNPGMHHAALLLSVPKRSQLRMNLELKYPTATLTVLRFDISHWADLAPGQGELVDFVTPAGL